MLAYDGTSLRFGVIWYVARVMKYRSLFTFPIEQITKGLKNTTEKTNF